MTARLLVERDRELAELDAAVAAAVGGTGRLVVVGGPAGGGRSSLLAEVRTAAAAAGALVLAARAGEFEREFAYGVVRTLLARALHDLGDDVRARVTAGPAVIALRFLEADDAPPLASGAALHGIHWLFANLAAERPIALVVDDAHWCDEASAAALAYLARRLEGTPILLALALDPGLSDRALIDSIDADPDRVDVRARPLSAAGVGILAERLLDDAPADVAVRVHARTGGNALLVHEALRDLAAGVALRPENAAEAGIGSARRLAQRRLARVSDAARAAARALAILGDAADASLVVEVARLPPAEVDAALTELAAAGFLDDARYALRHPLIRAAIRQDTSASERGTLARRAAEALNERGMPPEQTAAMLVTTPPAGDPDVVRILRAGAAAALARGAAPEAVAALERALVEPPEPAQRAAVLRELGVAERHANLPIAIGHLAGAARMAEGAERASAALELGRALHVAGRRSEAASELRRGLEAAPPDLAQALRGELVLLALFDSDESGTGVDPHDASQIDESLPGAATLLACAAMARARVGSDREEAIGLAWRAARCGIADGEAGSAPTATAIAVLVAAGHPGAAGLAGDAYGAAARVGSLPGRAASLKARGEALMARGRLGEAEADLQEAIEVAGRARSLVIGHLATTLLADCLLLRGDLRGAEAVLERGGTAPSETTSMLRAATRARAFIAARRPEDALREALSCGHQRSQIPLGNPAILPWRGLAAQAATALGDRERAAALSAEEVALAQEWGAAAPLARALLVHAVATGELDALDRAVAAAEALGPVDRAQALLQRGAALRRAGRRADGRADLSLALELAVAGGSSAIATAAAAELSTSGQPTTVPSAVGVASLTASERRVAALAAGGATNREIAQSLFVTQKTVETHLSRAFRKLGVGSRAALAAAVAEDGDGAVVLA